MVFGGILAPATFAFIFTAQLLWIWHSVNDFTRQGAGYAATHCWESSAGNVISCMQANVPMMPNQTQFQNGPAQIAVSYFAEDPTSGHSHRVQLRRRLHYRLHSGRGDRQRYRFSIPAVFDAAADRDAQFSSNRSHRELRLRSGTGNLRAVK